MNDWRARENQFSGWSAVFREVCTNFFLKQIKPGARVLDCGAGDGPVSFALAENGCYVDAIDLRPDRIKILEAEKGSLNVNGICGDFFNYPLPTGSYDYVISRQFMSHFQDRWRDVLLRKIELCKVGGAIIFHHLSADTIELSSGIAKGPKYKAAVERRYKGKGTARKRELEKFCDKNGLILENFTPVFFFDPRGTLYRSGLDRYERKEFRSQLDEWLSCAEVHRFVCWFEESVISKLPAGIATSYMAVLRKT